MSEADWLSRKRTRRDLREKTRPQHYRPPPFELDAETRHTLSLLLQISDGVDDASVRNLAPVSFGAKTGKALLDVIGELEGSASCGLISVFECKLSDRIAQPTTEQAEILRKELPVLSGEREEWELYCSSLERKKNALSAAIERKESDIREAIGEADRIRWVNGELSRWAVSRESSTLTMSAAETLLSPTLKQIVAMSRDMDATQAYLKECSIRIGKFL